MMHEYPVTRSVMLLAQRKAALMPKSPRNSIREGAGTLVGCIGEIILCRVLGATLVSPDNPYNFDMLVGDKTYEAKTKECTSIPRPHYFATVAASNTKQKCDYYAFLRVLRPKGGDYLKAWVMGWIPKEEFYDLAVFYREGDIDPTSPPGYSFDFKADCYNVPYSKLRQFKIIQAA
jgi:hypothetical protein